jgi:hypothetical protein
VEGSGRSDTFLEGLRKQEKVIQCSWYTGLKSSLALSGFKQIERGFRQFSIHVMSFAKEQNIYYDYQIMESDVSGSCSMHKDARYM